MRIILRDTCGKCEVCAFVVVGDLNESWSLESFSLAHFFQEFSKNTHQNIN